jgi:hypothetical protein
MDENIIIWYENKTLIIQTINIVEKGELRIIDRYSPENTILSHEIINTDFVRIKVELPIGKLQVQITTSEKRIIKNLIIHE